VILLGRDSLAGKRRDSSNKWPTKLKSLLARVIPVDEKTKSCSVEPILNTRRVPRF
jgi:hypothetical protein